MTQHPAPPRSLPSPRSRLPAVAFGLLVLGGLLALTWQARHWRDLRRQNAELQAVAANQTRHQANRVEAQRRSAADAEASRRQGEQNELVKLRTEVTRLREATSDLAALRAEAERLQAERAEAAARAGVVEEDPFSAARERGLRSACVSNMKQVGLAARIWSNDNQEVFPPDFLTLSNELNSPKLLTCPGDTSRKPAASWAEFDGGSVSYEFLAAGMKESVGPDVVLTRCPLHHCVGLVDGSVQRLDPAVQRVDKVGGLYKIVRVPQSAPP